MNHRLVIALALAFSAGCGSAADDLPGTYTGSLFSSVQASRMSDRRPDGNGGFVATVRHYTGGSSSDGARLTVRRTGEGGGNPSFEARVGDVCGVPFQLLEGGQISENMLLARCRCALDGEWVEGDATVFGSFTEGRLHFEVQVMLPRDVYTGGCTHTFDASAPP